MAISASFLFSAATVPDGSLPAACTSAGYTASILTFNGASVGVGLGKLVGVDVGAGLVGMAVSVGFASGTCVL